MNETERDLAVRLFNETWDLMEKKDRSPEDDFSMLHKAHASVYHWSQCGTDLEIARGEWQVSRVNAVLSKGEAALFHAERSLQLCLDNQFKGFDLAFGYEAVARSWMLLDDYVQASENRHKGIIACDLIDDADDKSYTLSALNEGFEKIIHPRD